MKNRLDILKKMEKIQSYQKHSALERMLSAKKRTAMVEEQYQSTVAQLENYRAVLSSDSKNGISVDQYAQRQTFIDLVQQLSLLRKQKHEESLHAEERCRQQWLKEAQELKTIERLSEKQEIFQQAEANRSEQKRIDEIAGKKPGQSI